MISAPWAVHDVSHVTDLSLRQQNWPPAQSSAPKHLKRQPPLQVSSPQLSAVDWMQHVSPSLQSFDPQRSVRGVGLAPSGGAASLAGPLGPDPESPPPSARFGSEVEGGAGASVEPNDEQATTRNAALTEITARIAVVLSPGAHDVPPGES